MKRGRTILRIAVGAIAAMTLLCVFVLLDPSDKKTDRFLQRLTVEEKQRLNDFFCELIQKDCFGHNLFGNKPISFVPYLFGPPFVTGHLFDEMKHTVILSRGKEIWERHENAIQSNNYFLRFVEENGFQLIYIINRHALISIVNKNLDLFQSILGPQTSAESIFRQVVEERKDLVQVINNNSILEGILFGYGRHNAIEHARFMHLSSFLEHPKIPPWKNPTESDDKLSGGEKLTIQLNTKWYTPGKDSSYDVTPREGFASISDEYRWYRSGGSATEANDDWSELTYFDYYGFLKFSDDEETKTIVSDYVRTRRLLSQLYSSGNFLEVTIKRMTGEL